MREAEEEGEKKFLVTCSLVAGLTQICDLCAATDLISDIPASLIRSLLISFSFFYFFLALFNIIWPNIYYCIWQLCSFFFFFVVSILFDWLLVS